MEKIIAALQAEIEAAKKKREVIFSTMKRRLMMSFEERNEYIRLGGYIDGLQTAVTLLEKEQLKELPY